ncbi:hypothetical protein AB0N81_15345 [Streptomyces sp. NPDC093510]|uniref:hypothetical protein n=1 Tax=Streptomyces sp. NPDC093510 TaxID=3155199 RepID=UPI00343F845C
MSIAFDALAAAALGGAGGQLGTNAAAALWERLRERFSRNPAVVAVLDERDPADPEAVRRLGGALRESAAADPGFHRELESLTARFGPAAPQFNTVSRSRGLNAPGATFTGPVTMNFADEPETDGPETEGPGTEGPGTEGLGTDEPETAGP